MLMHAGSMAWIPASCAACEQYTVGLTDIITNLYIVSLRSPRQLSVSGICILLLFDQMS